MEIRENDKLCIFAPLSAVLNKQESDRLFENIRKDSRRVAIDLSFVTDCTIDFISSLLNIAKVKDIGLFNISSDIFVLLNNMNVDKKVNLYVSELDFTENSRQLLNRKFSIIN